MKKYIVNGLLRWLSSNTGSHGSVKLRERKMKPSKLQHNIQDRFRNATAYAKSQMLDPELKAMYAARINKKMRSPYAVAVRDALTAPCVSRLDTSEYEGYASDVITVYATDDFKVERVKVTITDCHGNVAEAGEATNDLFHFARWKYVAKTNIGWLHGTRILATAFDLPGNEATLEKCIEGDESHRNNSIMNRYE